MASLKEIEKEIEKINARNKRVEADKSWETSSTRKIIIAVLTYIVIVIFFFFAGLQNPFVNAIVPATAFILSTFSLPFLKKLWIERIYKNRG